MAGDYAKKTVAELTEILKSRGLPHSGKKADLVARLNDADKQVEAESESLYAYHLSRTSTRLRSETRLSPGSLALNHPSFIAHGLVLMFIQRR